MRRIVFTALWSTLAACSAGVSPAALPPAVPALNAVAPGTPRAYGQYLFLHETWGQERFDSWPPTDFMLSLQQLEPAVFGNQFSAFGFIPDPHDDLPWGFKRGSQDPTRVNETCAACHVAQLPDGGVWLGLSASHLDFEGFRAAVDERWVAAGHPSRLGGPVGQRREASLGPGRTDASGGGYCVPIPVKFPPFLGLGARTRLNYLGTGRNLRTEVYLSLFAVGLGDPNQSTRVPFPDPSHVAAFVDFVGSLTPPGAPAQDATLIAEGAQVFHAAQCDGCHHPTDVASDDVATLPRAPSTPEVAPGVDPAYPRGTIQTDVLHRVLLSQLSGGSSACLYPDAGLLPPGDGGPPPRDGGIDPLVAQLEFIQDNNLLVAGTDGYRDGYLSALWARAPYLHNGSVSTLADLLKPAAQRPAHFQSGTFTVDTAVPGGSNQGHEFGVTLSAADQQALIAYLNSL